MKIKRWLYDHGIRWHAQNLARDGRGPMWQSGRAWINVFTGNGETGEGYRELFEIHPEWHLAFQNRAGISVAVGGGDSDRELQFSLSLPVGSVWLHIDGLPRAITDRILPGRWVQSARGPFKMTEEHELSLIWHSNMLWWSGWSSTNTWRSSDPWWRHASFSPVNALLGRTECTTETLTDWQPVSVPMPEGSYSGKARVRRWTWRRTRITIFPPKERVAVDIEMDDGQCLPFPGKGENAYDCGMDGLCGWSKDGTSIDAAIAHGVESALNSRARYGGSVNWRPPVPA